MSKDQYIRNLAKKLGTGYRIEIIDFEHVIYKDFGNGFNVEISGMHTTSERKKATIYLWFGNTFSNYVIISQVNHISQSDIGKVVDNLYEISEMCIKNGLVVSNDIKGMKSLAEKNIDTRYAEVF